VPLPEELQQTIRAFQESRTILTAVELDVFTAIGDGSGAVEVATKIGADVRATEMLLNALVALGLLTKQDGQFRNTPLAKQFLSADSPNDARAVVMHFANLWNYWSTLTNCVRAGTSVAYQEFTERDKAWTEPFIAAMHHNASARAPHVVQAVGATGLRRMLDVGGGSGAYSIAFARANPALEVELLDLPTVLPIAERHIAAAGLSGRIHTRAGDLRTDHLGENFDLIFVSAICHMLGPEENLSLLRRCYEALAPDGRVVISDFILSADKTAPKFGALFALNMLVATQNGNSYSEEEYREWLQQAGFTDIRRIPLPGPAELMMGRRH
jgi:2-polyprenyl-3-methyl-5-hydroxy-6-metoxy-1,4-benzoquinol methylase